MWWPFKKKFDHEKALLEFGFTLDQWDEHCFRYKRKAGSYIHIVAYLNKKDPIEPILQSYDASDSCVVGLTEEEMKLFLKAIKAYRRNLS